MVNTGNSQTSEVATSMTPSEAGQYLGVHAETIRRWIKSGHLPAVTVGLRGQYRVKREDLDTMVKAA